MAASISIVITTYNQEHYLGKAIESLLSQTRDDFELLIWDDGSIDNSVAIAQAYAKQDQRIRVVAAKHQGRGYALKTAIAQTKGTYLGWVDSDDLLAPTALAETAAILDAQPEVGMVYTSYLDIDKQDRIISYGFRCLIPYSPEGLLQNFMTFHFRLLRRSVYEQAGGINESFESVEDYELCLRLSEITQVQHLNQPLYYYRTHPQSLSHQRRPEQIRLGKLAVRQAYRRRGKFLASQLNTHKRVNEKRGRETSKQTGRRGDGETRRMEIPPKISLTPHKQTFTLHQKNLPFPIPNSPFPILNSSFFILHSLLILNSPFFTLNSSAQPIVSDNSTGTIVTPNGNQFNINGGTLSGDGANLFHSFSQFNLNQNQTANFPYQPLN